MVRVLLYCYSHFNQKINQNKRNVNIVEKNLKTKHQRVCFGDEATFQISSKMNKQNEGSENPHCVMF